MVHGSNVDFYDGRISGSTTTNGRIRNKPQGYSLNQGTNNNVQTVTLQPSSTETAVAKIGNVYYKTLQKAIESNNNVTIELQGNVNEETNLTILEEKTFTIDLNGKTIQNGIINNGTLTIIDNSTEQTGRINNNDGIGISNSSLGILTIGDNDESAVQVPEVQGSTYGIENLGILNFYDGKIKGATDSISGTFPIVPTNYMTTITTIDAIKIMTLISI